MYLNKIFNVLGPDKNKLPLLVTLFITMSMLDLLGIGLIAPFTSIVLNGDNFIQNPIYLFLESLGITLEHHKLVLYLTGFIIFIFIIKASYALLINRKIFSFSYNQGSRLRTQLMYSYQNMEYEEYLKRNSSEYIYSIQTLTLNFQSVMITLLRIVSESIVSLVIIFFLIVNSGVEIVFIGVFLLGVIFLYDLVFSKRTQEYGRLTNMYSINIVQAVQEGIKGLKEIRILGKEKYFYQIVKENSKKYSKLEVTSQLIMIAPRYLMELLLVISFVSYVFIIFLIEDNISSLLPTISMYAVASLRLVPSVNQIITGISQLRKGYDTVNKLSKDIDDSTKNIKPKTDIVSNNKYEDFQSLKANDISYKYSDVKKQVLSAASLEVNLGETIGIMGPSGSGKSTLVDVLLGLLKNQGSPILFNEKEMSSDLESIWLSQVAYLPQQVFILDDTLINNIAVGIEKEHINKKNILTALKQAKLDEVLDSLPDGLETVLGENGIRLSGGQRQRVALARAFYHNRNVLVMDEATSALDKDIEKEILDEIKFLKGKKTIIIISHHENILKYCDRIYLLDDGKTIIK